VVPGRVDFVVVNTNGGVVENFEDFFSTKSLIGFPISSPVTPVFEAPAIVIHVPTSKDANDVSSSRIVGVCSVCVVGLVQLVFTTRLLPMTLLPRFANPKADQPQNTLWSKRKKESISIFKKVYYTRKTALFLSHVK
jgi:hypothetical protein